MPTNDVPRFELQNLKLLNPMNTNSLMRGGGIYISMLEFITMGHNFVDRVEIVRDC